jgi:hypothetical protein
MRVQAAVNPPCDASSGPHATHENAAASQRSFTAQSMAMQVVAAPPAEVVPIAQGAHSPVARSQNVPRTQSTDVQPVAAPPGERCAAGQVKQARRDASQ